MSKIKIYIMDGCPYCIKAKQILNSKKVLFKEIKVVTDEDWENLEKTSGRETVPQIFC